MKSTAEEVGIRVKKALEAKYGTDCGVLGEPEINSFANGRGVEIVIPCDVSGNRFLSDQLKKSCFNVRFYDNDQLLNAMISWDCIYVQFNFTLASGGMNGWQKAIDFV